MSNWKVQMGKEVFTVTREQRDAIRQAVEDKMPLITIGNREYRTYAYKKSWEIGDFYDAPTPAQPVLPKHNPEGLRKIQMCASAVGLAAYRKNSYTDKEKNQIEEIQSQWKERQERRAKDPDYLLKEEFNRQTFDRFFPSFEVKLAEFSKWKEAQTPAFLAEFIFTQPSEGASQS